MRALISAGVLSHCWARATPCSSSANALREIVELLVEPTTHIRHLGQQKFVVDRASYRLALPQGVEGGGVVAAPTVCSPKDVPGVGDPAAVVCVRQNRESLLGTAGWRL